MIIDHSDLIIYAGCYLWLNSATLQPTVNWVNKWRFFLPFRIQIFIYIYIWHRKDKSTKLLSETTMAYLHYRFVKLLQAIKTRVSPCSQPLTYCYLSWYRKHGGLSSRKLLTSSNTSQTFSDNFSTNTRRKVCLNKSTLAQQAFRHASTSSIFISDQETNLSNFEFDPGLEAKLTDLERLRRNVQLRGVDVDVSKLVGDT